LLDAVSLFGGTFSLMEEWQFSLTLDQADAIAADLLAGKSRAVTLSRTCAGAWWRIRQAHGGDDGGLPGGSFRWRYG
jgi:hypothetical protein